MQRGRRRTADLAEVVGAICYKLKTGCQLRLLPVKALFTGEPLSWQGVLPLQCLMQAGCLEKLVAY